MGLLTKAKSILGDPNAREINKLKNIVEKTSSWEKQIEKLDDHGLRAKTLEFRDRIQHGESLEDILPEAFAVVREAGRRWLKMRHFDVQILGGAVLHQGKIAEMRTGEGKTLVATLPIYLNALEGKGVHLITVNDYLSKRDARWMAAIYDGLGLSVGVLQHQGSFLFDANYDGARSETQSNNGNQTKNETTAGDFLNLRPCTRQEAYAADITYGTNNEFGFDYLRDNMVLDIKDKVQRPLAFAIVDEVDNVLIDEARTPLIISGQAEEPLDTYRTFAKIVPSLKVGSDFTTEGKSRTVSLTEPGIEKIENALGINNIFEGENARLTRFLESALRAEFIYQRDQQYVIRDGRVVIVDEFTGRLMDGRRYSEGLHQAIEAKENVKIERETVTLAVITYQNYFRMYGKLAGMTGTAATEAEELAKIYSLDVIIIPTHRPMIRKDHTDMIFRSERAKFKAIVGAIESCNKHGQPVLVGTASVENSERISALLQRQGIKHEVLNAKNHEREADIIANAGEPKSVTIATNMAGRGTDIQLGEGISNQGGLFVLGTERHESRRIDNQLRGRSGRQGDPGESRFYVSFEDGIMHRFTPDWLPGMLERFGMDDDMPLESNMVGKALEQAQTKVEGHHFDIRKHLVDYDDVINKQREVIYKERNKILDGKEINSTINDMIQAEIRSFVTSHTDGEALRDLDLDLELFWSEVGTIIPLVDFNNSLIEEKYQGDLSEALVAYALDIRQQKEEDLGPDVMRQAERIITLRIIDQTWIQHLTEMDNFRQGVGLQAYGQADPLVTYKREAFDMFEQLTVTIRREVVRGILHINQSQNSSEDSGRQSPSAAGSKPIRRLLTPKPRTSDGTSTPSLNIGNIRETSGKDSRKAAVATSVPKIGRNAQCPCGSGKKYKRCHGAAV